MSIEEMLRGGVPNYPLDEDDLSNVNARQEGDRMNTNEAIQIANRWLGYLALQKARSERMQELARLARTDPKEAQRQMRRLDQQPHVFDGAELEPAVRELLTEIERLKTLWYADADPEETAYAEDFYSRLRALLVEARDKIKEEVEARYPGEILRESDAHLYHRELDIVCRIYAALTKKEDKT